MPKYNFELINPYLEGNINKIFKGKNADKVAEKFFLEFSQYIRNPLNNYYYTIKNLSTGKYHHYKVKESYTNEQNAETNYNLEQINIKNEKENVKYFEKTLNNIISQQGGKRKKKRKSKKSSESSDSESSSDSDFDSELMSSDSDIRDYESNRRFTSPISYYWYYPYFYGTDKLYIPHFSLPLSPLVQIHYDSSAFLNWLVIN